MPVSGGRGIVTARSSTGIDLPSTAQAYVDRWLGSARSSARGRPIARLAEAVVRRDERYCRETAAYYDAAPLFAYDAALQQSYNNFKLQSLRQYQAIVEAGIEVEPWLGDGQPYANSRQLREHVRRTGKLRLYLTGSGHGPSGDTDSSDGPGFHPLREPSGVSAEGVELCHNDVYRAVHDIFGHVMFGSGFGPYGEFLAAFCHLHMYSPDTHPVLFTEHVGQICWFFYGPHLADATGALPGKGEAGYVPPGRRPYPPQKVFAFPTRFLDGFTSMFQLQRSSDE